MKTADQLHKEALELERIEALGKFLDTAIERKCYCDLTHTCEIHRRNPNAPGRPNMPVCYNS